jgi:hypothetical protein
MDIMVTEMQTTIESLKKEVDDVRMAPISDDDEQPGICLPTTTQFQKMPRSAAVPVTSRATVSAPAAAPSVAPLVPPVASTPLAQQTSAEIFADTLLSTPTTSTHTGAASQRTSPPGATDRAQSDVYLFIYLNFLVLVVIGGDLVYIIRASSERVLAFSRLFFLSFVLLRDTFV